MFLIQEDRQPTPINVASTWTTILSPTWRLFCSIDSVVHMAAAAPSALNLIWITQFGAADDEASTGDSPLKTGPH